MVIQEFVRTLHPCAGTIDGWVALINVEKRKKKNTTGLCTRKEYEQAADRIFIFDGMFHRKDEHTATASGLV